MCQPLEAQITCAATKAKDLLGQLGPLAWALHVHHGDVIPSAIVVSVDPDEFVSVRIPRCEGERVRTSVVRCLTQLRERMSWEETPRLFTSEGLRATINRSIVVYAVSVLEAFLEKAARPVWEKRVAGGRGDSDDTCGCRRGWPTDGLEKIKRLADDASIDLRSLPSYLHSGWLVLVRNAIAHGEGKAERAVGDSRRYGLRHDAHGDPAPRWRSGCGDRGHKALVWDEDRGKQPTKGTWRGRTFSIAIDHFILPRLRDAQAFVTEAEEVLRQAARNRTSASGASE